MTLITRQINLQALTYLSNVCMLDVQRLSQTVPGTMCTTKHTGYAYRAVSTRLWSYSYSSSNEETRGTEGDSTLVLYIRKETRMR